MRDRTLLWALLGAAGVGALYALRGRGASLALSIGTAMNAAEETLFRLVIPAVARPYADVILRVGQETGISPFLIAQLGYRESLWGASSALDVPGPAGRGDNGHGHGLFQIDDRSFGTWLATHNWQDPYTNCSFAIGTVLQGKINFFTATSPVAGITDGTWVTVTGAHANARGVDDGEYPDPRPLSGDALTKAAVAAFNTGEGNTLMSLACGVDPDVTTAAGSGASTGNYSNDVLTRMASLISNFNAQTTGVS